MKILVSLVLLSLVTFNATAELTKNDIQEIEKLLDKYDKQIKQYIDMKLVRLESTITERIDKVDGKVDKVDENIAKVDGKVDMLMWFLVLLVAIIIGAIALPQAFQLWRERRESKQFDMVDNQIEKMQQQFDVIMKELDSLKQEIITLKEERTRLIQP